MAEEIAQMRLDYSTDQRVWDLLDEVERLREAVDGLTANVKRWRNRASAERLKRQRWRKRALAAEAEVKRLREALRDLADAYRGIAIDHPTVVTRHLPLIRAEEVLFGSDDRG